MKLDKKLQAIKLRSKGYSIKEIRALLDVSQSSVSLWVRNVKLGNSAKKRLLSRLKLGQYNSAIKKKASVLELNSRLKLEITAKFSKTQISLNTKQLLCALIYWCEGTKDYRSGISFTNSDPYLTRLFINLLVEAYGAERNKFVARLHLHEYHNAKKQQQFWKNVLKLNSSQFYRPYLKPHTGKRYRDNYPGCISIRYYDSILARKLMFLAQIFTGGMV